MQRNLPRLFASFLMALLLATPMKAHAETLDDATIRKVFSDMSEAIHDTGKTRELMQARLDEMYVLKETVTRTIGSQPQDKISQSRTKPQAIGDTLNTIGNTKIGQYDSKIQSIQYSNDKKYAYVNDTVTSSGTLDTQSEEKKTYAIGFSAKEACSHILSLDGDKVKITQSQCDQEVTLK